MINFEYGSKMQRQKITQKFIFFVMILLFAIGLTNCEGLGTETCNPKKPGVICEDSDSPQPLYQPPSDDDGDEEGDETELQYEEPCNDDDDDPDNDCSENENSSVVRQVLE